MKNSIKKLIFPIIIVVLLITMPKNKCSNCYAAAVSDEMFCMYAQDNLGEFTETVNSFEAGCFRIASAGDIVSARAYFIITSDFCHIHGYQGLTVIGIVIDDSCRILNTILISSEDTPAYVRKIKRSGYLSQYEGYQENDDGITAVTGATITSRAIEESINKSLQTITKFIKPLKDKGVGLNTIKILNQNKHIKE